MDTRSLGYLGLGALMAIVFVTLMGVPPAVWITVVLIAAGIGTTYLIRRAQDDGVDVASRMVAPDTDLSGHDPEPTTSDVPVRVSDVDVELVRAADEAEGTPAVWLHRSGGRRVHRYESPDAWVVQQVSTKDPDNPKKRVIGETLTFATESQATRAADDLAQGVRPTNEQTDRVAHPSLSVEPSL